MVARVVVRGSKSIELPSVEPLYNAEMIIVPGKVVDGRVEVDADLAKARP
ncbi:MAG TPA: hypothetical protein VEL79_09100 [Vicinamibacterales bacterium]|nr:hypothetical protein [Vicinamibacterales bacterium]